MYQQQALCAPKSLKYGEKHFLQANYPSLIQISLYLLTKHENLIKRLIYHKLIKIVKETHRFWSLTPECAAINLRISALNIFYFMIQSKLP